MSSKDNGTRWLPYDIAVAAVYGGLAYATNSTFPGMILHSGGNVLSAVSLFTQGRSEWQLGGGQTVLVWQSGIDGPFVMNMIAFVVVSAGAFLTYRGLVSAGREARLHAG